MKLVLKFQLFLASLLNALEDAAHRRAKSVASILDSVEDAAHKIMPGGMDSLTRLFLVVGVTCILTSMLCCALVWFAPLLHSGEALKLATFDLGMSVVGVVAVFAAFARRFKGVTLIIFYR